MGLASIWSIILYEQNQDGGAWAYAAAGAVTGNWLAKYQDTAMAATFSPQMLQDCVSRPDGQEPTVNDAYEYIKYVGAIPS